MLTTNGFLSVYILDTKKTEKSLKNKTA